MSASFTPSQQELALTAKIFEVADTQKIGIITGDAAIKAFAGSKLQPVALGKIWSLADTENNGFLTRKGVAIVVRLIGWAQKGETVTESHIDKPGPLAVIDGISLPVAPGQSAASPRATPAPTFPPLTAEERAKFLRLFVSCGPTNGVLSGEKARDIFMKSKLPVEKLTKIWSLADTHNRGSLDSADFAIGMYFIQIVMANSAAVLPATLPPSLYEQASGGKSLESVRTHPTGGSFSSLGSPSHSSFPTPPLKQQHTGQPVPQQYTGQPLTQQYTGQPLTQQYTGQSTSQYSAVRPRPPPVPARPTVTTSASPFPLAAAQVPWDITPAEKATSDSFFDGLDTQRRGYIEGDVAVPFMLQSNLPESTLAQIWDLADLSNDGRLTKDGFAVAMHLINGQLAGKEVPKSLPPSLVPPSHRVGNQAAQAAPVPEPQKDLWLLDDSPPPSAVQPQTTGLQTPQAAVRHVALPPTSPGHSAFAPAKHDFLGDDDDSASHAAVPASSAEIGNLQNQLNSTNRSLATAKEERTSVESNLATSASTLAQLQSQLASAKASYETETKLLGDLRERFNNQAAEIRTAKEELIRAESDLSAARLEKAEIEGAVLRDKEEVRLLQRKVKETTDETAEIKKAIEKAKKDVRHQKGLLAIAKKQLGSAENDKEKANKELAETNEELHEVTEAVNTANAEGAARAASPNGVTSSPQERAVSPPVVATVDPTLFDSNPASPLSNASAKSNNPFERLFGANTDMVAQPPPTNSPFAIFTPDQESKPQENTDDPFGFNEEPADPQPLSPPNPPPTGDKTPEDTADKKIDEKPALVEAAAAPSTSLPQENGALATASPPSEAAARFPDLDAPDVKAAPSKDAEKDLDTEFPPVQEIQESDDDTTDSDDDEPLANLRASVKSQTTPAAAPSAPEVTTEGQPTAVPQPTVSTLTNGTTSSTTTAPSTAFDDTFGTTTAGTSKPSSTTGSPALVPKRTLSSQSLKTKDAFGAEPPTPFEPTEDDHAPPPTIETVLEPNVAKGVSDFDEAFGKLPSAAPKDAASAPGITFESTFGDSFDFGGSSFAPASTTVAPVATPAVNGHTKQAPSDDLAPFDPFSSSTKPVPAASSGDAKPFSFDDAFGGPLTTDSKQNNQTPLSFDDAFNVPKTSSEVPAPSAPPATTVSIPAMPAPVPVTSTIRAPVSPESPVAPSTPPREPTPKPREPSQASSSSPIPRPTSPNAGPTSPSSGSRMSIFRASSPKPKPTSPPGPPPELPTKHSKLSLHFNPFSRKKDKDKAQKGHVQQAKPPPGPPPLHPQATPGGDQADEVGQLVAMGFTREQAVSALESHGYDVQRALNSLLS